MKAKQAQNCAKQFKFALVPKVQNELVNLNITELLAHEERTFVNWMAALKQVIDALDEEGKPTISYTVRAGVRDLETAVKAANA